MARLGVNGIGIPKLKSVIKRLNSLKTTRECKRSVSPDSDPDHGGADLHTVYVGRSRRRFLLTTTVVSHPLFQELVERSAADHGLRSRDDPMTVACEVVLFEHLLWMLENADDEETGSLDSLVEFYTC